MKKFLVTGGDGFIGSAVCEMLLNMGVNVVLLDNRSRSRKFAKKKLYFCKNVLYEKCLSIFTSLLPYTYCIYCNDVFYYFGHYW